MIAIIVDSLIGNDYTLCLCEGLSNSGVEVFLIVPENRQISDSTNFNVLPWAPTKNIKSSKIMKLLKYFGYLIRLTNFMLRNKNGVVHFQFFRNERFESIYYFFLKLLGINLIYTAHNIIPHESVIIDPLLKKLVYKASNGIIVHSKFLKHALIKKFKIKQNKIHVIPHGNFDAFLPKKPLSRKEARRFFGLNDNDQVLLFFGKIRKYKGLDLLLKAFDIAKEDNKNLRLLIGGSTNKDNYDYYANEISQLPSREYITFNAKHIPEEEVAYYFIASDLLVLPYINIYHSGVIHVAFPFAKPIIATSVGDLPDFIEDGKMGFLAEPNDPVELSNKIILAFSKVDVLEKMGEFIKLKNQNDYSWDNIGQKTAELYKNLIK